MKFSKQDLLWAVGQGIISESQARDFENALTKKLENNPQFMLGHVIYYFGGLLIISAMSWFLVRAWENLGGEGILAAAVFYAFLFYAIGTAFWRKPGYKIPGGLLFTAGVSMTPLAVYGFQRWTGMWMDSDPGLYHDFYLWIKGGWFPMEVATIIVGLFTLYFIRYPFLTFPVAFSLWFMSMDISRLLLDDGHSYWQLQKTVSMYFGLSMLVLSYAIDRKTYQDYAFWIYLFGLTAFWGGLTAMESNSEAAKFVYCMLNVFLIFLSVFLSRRIFIIFGTVGVFIYLGHLTQKVFADSLWFPVALSALGLGVIFIGVWYQKNRRRIDRWLIASLPSSIKKLRPADRSNG
jgi:hypothetical protein